MQILIGPIRVSGTSRVLLRYIIINRSYEDNEIHSLLEQGFAFLEASVKNQGKP